MTVLVLVQVVPPTGRRLAAANAAWSVDYVVVLSAEEAPWRVWVLVDMSVIRCDHRGIL